MVKSHGTRELVEFVRHDLREHADPERAPAMAAYMKTTMPFLGVGVKDIRNAARVAARAYPPADQAAYEASVLALWNLDHREEKHVAVAYAREFERYIRPGSLGLYERLVREGAWWDFVDEIAIHLVGATLLKNPKEVWPVMDRWIEDADMWVRRTAILCQNRHRANTDEERLFRYCLTRAGEKEFFIRKAIGWALREYAYTAPDAVRRFIDDHRGVLSNLSVREGGKHLK
jgi:3-methyladenine DNA glycosylase AlkD